MTPLRTPLRPGSADLALAATLALVGVLSTTGRPSVAAAVAGVGALVQVAALLFVRTSPTAAALVFAATVPVVVATGLGPGSLGWPLLAFLIGLHRGGPAVPAVALVVAEIAAWTVTGWPNGPLDLVSVGVVLLVAGLAWGLGRLRRAARDRERRRHDAAERARLAALAGAERRRIAEELGTVVLDELRRVADLAAGLRAAVAAAGSARPDSGGTAAEVGEASRPHVAGVTAEAARRDAAGATGVGEASRPHVAGVTATEAARRDAAGATGVGEVSGLDVAGAMTAEAARPEGAGAADAALAELRQAARSALAAMRRVLAVLRSADDGVVGAAPETPPLRWWEPRAPSTSGVVLAVCAAAAVTLTAALRPSPGGGPDLVWLAGQLDLPLDRPSLLALLAVEVAALAWWRTWPLPALAVATAASGALTVAAATHIVAELSVFVLVFAAGAFAAPLASGCTVAACAVVLEAELLFFDPGRPLTVGDWVLPVVTVGGLWLVGVLVRRARRHRDECRAERAAGRSRARLTDERLRIARELHDLVAHHASAVAVQASAARSNPATLPEAVTHIEDGGLRIAEAVRALADLAPPTRPPAPLSRAAVEEVLAPARAAGLPVTAEVEGDPAAEPGEADLFAHRIVVEALTNVLRHAGPSATRLRVQHRPGEVVVEVRDSGVLPGHRAATRGSGLGLVGMRERAALLGGDAEAGPGDGAGWVVRARLPRTLPAAAPPA